MNGKPGIYPPIDVVYLNPDFSALIIENSLGNSQEIPPRSAQDFYPFSRRENQHIVSYVTVFTMRKTGKKTSEIGDVIRCELPYTKSGLT
ncbi:Uncharacterised protein [Candidatus Venteria ishoeyi]|uniref:Uncharacterized protein n=1 Tax=Candidatus Venteria ishoeyi TaxID=1899563 RepID=A0A1H6FDU9_9GAMM|nr:Uncharacterised protein [Candidatus Venteria ishoeyi]